MPHDNNLSVPNPCCLFALVIYISDSHGKKKKNKNKSSLKHVVVVVVVAAVVVVVVAAVVVEMRGAEHDVKFPGLLVSLQICT